MQHFPEVFTPFIVSMVNVGQSGGRLAEAFLQINQYLELESNAVKKAKIALRYPLFVVIAIFAAIIVINIFVIPSFATVFAASNVPLPWATRVLIKSSLFMVKYWLYLLIGIFILLGLFFQYIHSIKGKLRWDQLLLKMPIIGRILKRIVLLRFAQSFSIVITSGIPLIQGIELVAKSINNTYAREKILSMREAIERGNNLTQAATGTGLFTALELQMLGVSEQTGELGEMLDQIAGFYKREVDYDLQRISDFIEPVLIIALSGMILLLAFAVYLPIWNMIKLTK
jgi:MSHA biogenesis protein MshG